MCETWIYHMTVSPTGGMKWLVKPTLSELPPLILLENSCNLFPFFFINEIAMHLMFRMQAEPTKGLLECEK